MRLVTVLCLALFCRGDVIVEMKPLSLASTRAVFGRGREVGIWYADVCNAASAPAMLPRQAILMQFPEVHQIPNRLAADLLSRRAARDLRSVLGSDGASFASSATTTIGIAVKSNATAYAGLAASGMALLLALAQKNAPSPAAYYSDLMPDQVSLAAGNCATWMVVASLTKNARTVGPATISWPVTAIAPPGTTGTKP